MKIHFKISPQRKGKIGSNFDGSISPYWRRQLADMFRGWHKEPQKEKKTQSK